MENEEQAIRARQIGKSAQFAALIGKRKLRNALARFGAGLITIVRSPEMLRVQLRGYSLTRRAHPPEFAHDGGFLSQIAGNLIGSGHVFTISRKQSPPC